MILLPRRHRRGHVNGNGHLRYAIIICADNLSKIEDVIVVVLEVSKREMFSHPAYVSSPEDVAHPVQSGILVFLQMIDVNELGRFVRYHTISRRAISSPPLRVLQDPLTGWNSALSFVS